LRYRLSSGGFQAVYLAGGYTDAIIEQMANRMLHHSSFTGRRRAGYDDESQLQILDPDLSRLQRLSVTKTCDSLRRKDIS
jgi:hypothetical protein